MERILIELSYHVTEINAWAHVGYLKRGWARTWGESTCPSKFNWTIYRFNHHLDGALIPAYGHCFCKCATGGGLKGLYPYWTRFQFFSHKPAEMIDDVDLRVTMRRVKYCMLK